MWLILASCEHVKGEEAVSVEIGNFATKSTSGTQAKAWACKVSWSEGEKGKLDGQARRAAWCLYTGGSNYGAKFEVDEQYSPWDQEWGKGGSRELKREREAEGGDPSCFSSP